MEMRELRDRTCGAKTTFSLLDGVGDFLPLLLTENLMQISSPLSLQTCCVCIPVTSLLLHDGGLHLACNLERGPGLAPFLKVLCSLSSQPSI